jgi:hypothetical protein
MRILNFDEVSLCYSTKKEPRWCRLHRWVWAPRCSLRRGVWTHRCRLHRQVRIPRCSLHRWVQIIDVAYTEDSTKKFFSQKLTGVCYTGESGLTGVGYTGESRLPGVAYTGESLVQPSRPASALKGTIHLKSRLWVLSTGYWEGILVLNIFLTWLLLIDSPV